MEAKLTLQKSLSDEAYTYLSLFYKEYDAEVTAFEPRWREIQAEIATHGHYWQRLEELTVGAKIAWRNSNRCIGRLYWDTLLVHDYRQLTKSTEIFDALVEHIRFATNKGKIRPLISIFAPQQPRQDGIRIWNAQLIGYAGYRQPDGSILGDPLHVALTDIALKLGWRSERTAFDILPLIIQLPNEPPEWFEFPRDVILEIPLSHPDYVWFEALGLRWYALPAVSNMRLEIGGINYTAAPFSGWYMVTEIGARDLGDQKRYDLLPVVAQKMGLDTRSSRSLWKDRAIVELNVAVMHSFTKHGVTMLDHHTASRQFMRQIAREEEAGRITPAEWSWIVPPISGSTTPVFHRNYKNVIYKPNFFYQRIPWEKDDA